jgi:hypothetical protein
LESTFQKCFYDENNVITSNFKNQNIPPKVVPKAGRCGLCYLVYTHWTNQTIRMSLHKFESLLASIQELFLEILHGDTKV